METTSLVPDAHFLECACCLHRPCISRLHGLCVRPEDHANRPDTALCNALLTMHACCGCIDRAYIVFKLIPIRNIVSWNALIAGLTCHGFRLEAISTFEAMHKDSNVPSPDSVTIVAFLTGCSPSGLVEEGKVYFEMMVKDYGIEPFIEHLSYLIYVLGWAGLVREGEEYAKKFEGEDLVSGGRLLSACRLHGDLEAEKRVGSRILKMGPDVGSLYVLVFNMFAREKKWEEAGKTRKVRRESRAKKEVGWSWVQM
ncbi:pentatricopeptide repeat-containing protein At4g14820 [Amborella trichopoda]|uniref:Pentatricopeptide repeat-containing protein n=1 Tax=Amborella trichopoda TaxID=13333 RepID=W1NHJ0_AMBTC|nr:pentatricopeptide repeat-containing protein At4g14820 [Amborella trichopoda]ERM94963.1 hypothetical protein AMTR_s00009p00215900 [Amborella trichopoda]|eukprot:XP_006827547.1 pentatricopeptide repeat-containing protein At4g14820 [Amborella trichopoda]